jgi:hypothetical protein
VSSGLASLLSGSNRRIGSDYWARVSGILTTTAAAALLFVLCERLSAMAPVESDSASAVLQGHAIGTGNALLRGWTLSKASFLATDLPFYAASALLRGVSPEAARDAGSAIYTLLILSACLLAGGQARGHTAVVRMAIPLLLLVAPAAGAAASQVLLGPFHVGTTLLLMLTLILVDRARHRLMGIVGVWALLTLAILSDLLALVVGVVPLAVVFGARHLGRWGLRWPDSPMLLALVLAPPTAIVLEHLLNGLGGFNTVPLGGGPAHIEDIPGNLAVTAGSILLVFGVDFFARPRTAATQASLVHLVGLIVVAAVWSRVILAWRSDKEADPVTQALAAGMAIDVAAYLFSNQPTGLGTARYLVPLLVFGAVLAGRHAARWISRGRRGTLLLAVAGAYAGVLLITLKAPVPSNDEAALTAFLRREHLTYGLSDYWDASSVTVATRSHVLVRPIALSGKAAHAYRWEAADAWFDASIPGNDARFVLRNTSRPESPERRQTEAAFGPPSREWRVGHYEVWIWDRNLLHDLDPAPT